MHHGTHVDGAMPRARANLPLLDCYNQPILDCLFVKITGGAVLPSSAPTDLRIRANIRVLRHLSVF